MENIYFKLLLILSNKEFIEEIYNHKKMSMTNSLVLTKEECANTKFGTMDEVVQMVKNMKENDSPPPVTTKHNQRKTKK